MTLVQHYKLVHLTLPHSKCPIVILPVLQVSIYGYSKYDHLSPWQQNPEILSKPNVLKKILIPESILNHAIGHCYNPKAITFLFPLHWYM